MEGHCKSDLAGAIIEEKREQTRRQAWRPGSTRAEAISSRVPSDSSTDGSQCSSSCTVLIPTDRRRDSDSKSAPGGRETYARCKIAGAWRETCSRGPSPSCVNAPRDATRTSRSRSCDCAAPKLSPFNFGTIPFFRAHTSGAYLSAVCSPPAATKHSVYFACRFLQSVTVIENFFCVRTAPAIRPKIQTYQKNDDQKSGFVNGRST